MIHCFQSLHTPEEIDHHSTSTKLHRANQITRVAPPTTWARPLDSDSKRPLPSSCQRISRNLGDDDAIICFCD
ncbi:hypothetical protein RRG08_007775 [Elysia crispata]|uniref:Uncharacterized protein n=1 Tax=Elysia crispata TaxID=231223 RepID=A0AAE1B1V0_9GAST|nr:hypothetical protein RRG08_007775 [Elysia crispata]